VLRGKSQSLPFGSGTLDAVITDPPYYDNVSYSNLSDFFFVWLKRMLSDVLPEHFSLDLTPKRSEIISAF
jgi:putative DNA methylase